MTVVVVLLGCGSVSNGGDADGGSDHRSDGGATATDGAGPPVTVRRALVEAGPWSAIVIGDSGLPVVFFVDDDPEVSDLRVLDCDTPTCDEADLSSRALEVPGANSSFRATIDPQGRPILAYRQDAFNEGEGKFLRCADRRCRTTPPEIARAIEQSGDGEFASIALQDSGLPMLAWRDVLGGTVDVFLCDDAVCSNPTTIAVGLPNAGFGAAIALAPSGFPVIASQSVLEGQGAIRVSVCGNASCSARVDRDWTSDDSQGYELALAIPGDGQPLVFHRDQTTGELVASKCGGTDCSVHDSTPIDGPEEAQPTGYHITAAIAPDGLALAAYHDPGEGALKIARCNDATCADPIIRVVDDGQRGVDSHVVGLHPHLAFAADGNPVISYADQTDGMIYLAFCGAADCESAE